MDTIVVTGAHGFIGRHTALEAMTRGARVIGIGHGDWSDDEARRWGIADWRRCDVTLETLTQHAESANAIIHCAGSGSAGLALSKPAQDFARSVGTTVEVLEFIRTRSPQTALVYPSSGAVYGPSPSIPTGEDTALNPISPYGVHKKVAEDMVRSYARSFGIRAALVRVFSVYGAGLRKQLWWDACQKAMVDDFRFMGTGTETRDWVAVEDVAALMLIAGHRAATDAPSVNCATGLETSVRDVVAALLAELGTDREPCFSGERRPGDPERYAGDPSRAVTWGWRPKRTWRTGVFEYARWFLASAT